MNALSRIIEVLRDKQDRKIIGQDVFFRGQREMQELIPSLLRKSMKYRKSLPKTENNFYCDAWVMAAGDISITHNSWEVLALFQHYEIPTRLLDWSSSLTSALFFSLLPCIKCKHSGNCNKLRKSCNGNPTIWVLDPHKMHQALHGNTDIASKVAVTIGVDPIEDYKDEFVLKEASSNKWPYKAGPVFLEIPWGDTRMKSQKGFFTFHPDDRSLDTLINESSGLVKIVISKRDRSDIVNEFTALGINEHDMFTDLVSLANYFKRRYTTI